MTSTGGLRSVGQAGRRAFSRRSWRRSLDDVGTAYAKLRSVVALRRAGPTAVGYVGFVGHGNAGDEAVRAATAGVLATDHVVPLARAAPTWVGARWRATPAAWALGGGTLVGRYGWRPLLESWVATAPTSPRFSMGVGVEDPGYAGAQALTDLDELRAWGPLLGSMARLSVRGPLSAALLAEHLDLEVPVVGDPALLLQPDPSVAAADGLLAVNLATVETLHGDDPDRLEAAVAAAAARWVAGGGRVRLVCLWEPDRAVTARLREQLGSGVESEVATSNPATALDSIAGCQVALTMRLHGSVLAAAAGVPAVMLDYRPKCRDFAASIGSESRLVRTDEATTERVTAALDDLCTDLAGAATAVGAGVERCRAALRAEADSINQLLRDGA